jgi:DNA-binding response OmpR family regulator
MPERERSQRTEGVPPRLVVVEDDPGLRMDLVEFLEDRGFSVREAVDGGELDRHLAAGPADLVILDVMLPGESGMDIARRLRRDHDLGILMLTCLGDTRTHLAGLDAGADAYLVKNVDLSVVEATVRALLRRRGANATPAESGHEVAWSEPVARPQDPGAPIWIYDSVYWSLGAPNGVSVRLTPKERSLIEALLSKPHETVSRTAILAAVGYREDTFGSRALDALVRRLRRKIVEETGVELPVQTVHAYGYVFSGPARIK